MDRIWTRYYRADGQPNTRLPSEGIGLDIVREILLMHNSKYGVESQNGEIQFYFTLTLAPAGK
jgi:signal transduction histidine kinase